MAAKRGAAVAELEIAAPDVATLQSELAQRSAELAIVNEIVHSLARQRDFGQILEAVGDRAAAALNVRGMSISTEDPATNELTFHFWIDEGERNYAMEGIKLADSLSREILDTNRAVRIGSAEEAAERGTPFKIGETESYLGVPIQAGDRAIGVFALGTRERNAYSDADERLVTTMASAMGVALDNARLAARTRQRVAELAIVSEVNEAVGRQLGPEAVIELVGDRVLEKFDADIAYVALLDKSGAAIDFTYYNAGGKKEPQPSSAYGDGWTSRILMSGQALRVNNEQERDTTESHLPGPPPKSYLGVPIRVGEDSIGVLAVESTRDEEAFDDADQNLLSTIAAGVGVAIQNARLFAEMEKAKEAAETANEAKSTFLASVSHELRTPLTSVVGFAKVIRRQLEERILPNVLADDVRTQRAISQVRANVEVIVIEGERLTTLVNNVLDLAKIEAGHFEWATQPTSLAEVIDRAAVTTAGLFDNKGIQLRREVPADLPEVEADHDGLVQVVINLLSNAAKFTDSGSVTCRAGLDDEGITVSVTDTGPGISAEDQARVFDKFIQVGDTLTDKPHGTGLGLTICREIVQWHGGRIWVESKVGKGSTFSFVIPIR